MPRARTRSAKVERIRDDNGYWRDEDVQEKNEPRALDAGFAGSLLGLALVRSLRPAPENFRKTYGRLELIALDLSYLTVATVAVEQRHGSPPFPVSN